MPVGVKYSNIFATNAQRLVFYVANLKNPRQEVGNFGLEYLYLYISIASVKSLLLSWPHFAVYTHFNVELNYDGFGCC